MKPDIAWGPGATGRPDHERAAQDGAAGHHLKGDVSTQRPSAHERALYVEGEEHVVHRVGVAAERVGLLGEGCVV